MLDLGIHFDSAVETEQNTGLGVGSSSVNHSSHRADADLLTVQTKAKVETQAKLHTRDQEMNKINNLQLQDNTTIGRNRCVTPPPRRRYRL